MRLFKTKIWRQAALMLAMALFLSGCSGDSGGSDAPAGGVSGSEAEPERQALQPLQLRGSVTTVAGRSLIGSSDGVGSLVRFFQPEGVASDGTFIYIADSGNHTVRRLDPASGAVVTVAGTAGMAGDLDGPNGLLRQPGGLAYNNGKLYISDFSAHTIRSLDLTSGDLATIAGTPGVSGSSDGTSARFFSPSGLAVDGTYLYITDTFNSTIRRLNLASGSVDTVAGTPGTYNSTDGSGPTARFACPHGIALHQGMLYISDTYSNTVRQLDPVTRAVITIAGTTGSSGYRDGRDALFGMPAGIVSDGVSLYVAEKHAQTLRRLEFNNGAWTTTTIAGSPWQEGSSDGSAAAFRYPGGLTIHGGQLYLADTFNSSLRRVELASRSVATIAGSSGSAGWRDGQDPLFNQPTSIAGDGTFLYIIDNGNYVVRRFNPADGSVETIAGSPGQKGYVDGVGALARFDNSGGIAFAAGALYVADSYNHVIRRIDLASRQVTTVAGAAGCRGFIDGPGSDARFSFPTGLTVLQGYLYVVDSNNLAIRKIAMVNGSVRTVASTRLPDLSSDSVVIATGYELFDRIYDITNDGLYLYVTESFLGTIKRIEPGSGATETIAGTSGAGRSSDGSGTSATFLAPGDISSDGANLYISDNGLLRRLALADHAVTTVAGLAGEAGSSDGLGAAARFSLPAGSVATAEGLYLLDSGNNTLRLLK